MLIREISPYKDGAKSRFDANFSKGNGSWVGAQRAQAHRIRTSSSPLRLPFKATRQWVVS